MTPTIRTIAQADWAPHIEATVRAIAAAAVACYVAGYFTGQWLHRLNDALVALFAREPKRAQPQPLIVQRQAAEPVAIAPPASFPVWVHISDPMARAIRLVRTEGKSQRLAADLCGVSRSSLQRALKAA